MLKKLKDILKVVGPGIITGAADDDPSGIATYSQTGAQFGFKQLWTSLYILPFMTAVQEACARIGAVTGKGLVKVIKENYSKKLALSATLLILVANTINLGADIGSMASSTALVIPGVNIFLLSLFFVTVILLLEVFTTYKTYARVLKWLSFALLSYVASIFIISVPWKDVIVATILPHIEFNFQYFYILTGLLGTTISPYMFFWQASEETEEEREEHLIKKGKVYMTWKFIKNLRVDTLIGMIFSQVGSWTITIVAATVLFTHGVTNIASASDAAKALEPLVSSFPNSGYFAKVLFASGVVGLGFLAVPILSGSAAYAFAEMFNFSEGFNLKLKKAHGFYGAITISTLVGLGINFIGIDPIRALIISAVINGVIAVPLLFIIAKTASNEKIMGKYKSGKISNFLVWGTFALMLSAALSMMYLYING